MSYIISKFVSKIVRSNSEVGKVIYNSFWLISDRVFKLFIGLFTSIVVTRYLGPERFGIMSFIVAYTTLFTAIASFGLEKIITVELSKDIYDEGKVMGTGFILHLLGGAVSFILAILIFNILNDEVELLLFVIIMSIPLVFQSFDIIRYWFQSKSQSKSVVLYRNIVTVTFVVIKLFFVKLNLSLIYFIIISSLELIFNYIAISIAYRIKKDKRIKWGFSSSYAKRYFNLGWPLIIGTLATTIYMKIDQLMIKFYLGDLQVGIYSVAVQLAELWYFIPSSLLISMLPYLSRIKEEEEYYKIMQKYMNFMVYSGYGIALFMSIFSSTLINFLYGEAYKDSANVLLIYIWSGVFINVALARGAFFITSGQSILSLKVTSIGAVSNVILNIILIPKMGYIGAAYATLISYFIYGYLTSFMFKELNRMKYIQTNSLLIFRRDKNGRKN